MANSGGHWSTLDEVKKLTLATLIPGVVKEIVMRGNPLELLPMDQANQTGSEIDYLRQATSAKDDVASIAVGGQTSFTEGITYTKKTKELRAKYLQRKLDKFVQNIYGNFNNYEETVLEEMLDGMSLKLGDAIVYDDYTYDANSLEMDGLHAIGAENYGTDLNIDNGEVGLSLANWRKASDAMKYGVDFWLVPFEIGRHIDASYQEVGFAGLATATAGNLGLISWGKDEISGGRISYFDNKPIIRSDFLLAEQANTGTGASSNKRAKYSSSTKNYSIFGIKRRVAGLEKADPGLTFLFGQMSDAVKQGQMVNLEYFDKLENWIGKAMRTTTYSELLPGSSMAICRIFDITDAAITV